MTHILTIRRSFTAPPERVYAAWTTPEHFARWIGPVGVPCDLLEMNPVEGGRFRLDMNLSNGQVIHVAGAFTHLSPPDRIDLTWGAADGSITTSVTIRFRPTAAGTEMEFRHHLPAADMLASHNEGWSSAFDKLQIFLET